MKPIEIILPLFPLIIYTLAFLILCIKPAVKIIVPVEDRTHEVLNNEAASALNLIGFSLTIFSVFISLSNVNENFISYYHVSLSIAYFIATYALLQVRLFTIFIYFSRAFRNSGITVLISGMLYITNSNEILKGVNVVFIVLLILFVMYLFADVFFYVRRSFKIQKL